MRRKARELSWGRISSKEQDVLTPAWCDELSRLFKYNEQTLLAYGKGRSYGDSCLNTEGALIEMTGLNRILSFDIEKGEIECEAGVTLADLLKVIVPKGWFLPVTPGTKFVTIGGAIANDIHGKNHHVAGTFGRHIASLTLLRSDQSIFVCSPTENEAHFRATIGGLGLTGVISRAKIKLKRINTSLIEVKTIIFNNIQEFFDLIDQFDQTFEYTVAWLDCLASGDHLGRGVLYCGRHSETTSQGELEKFSPKARNLVVPFEGPEFLLNQYTIKIFNHLYFNLAKRHDGKIKLDSYEHFFYPLDGIERWNLLYGHRGLSQYQFVLPLEQKDGFVEILKVIANSRLGSFLAVVKKFGDLPSPGLLSFPKVGYTLALDFPNSGQPLRNLFTELNVLVQKYQGRLYPAKDGQMPALFFKESYSQLTEFKRCIDPRFQSDFWARMQPDS